MLKVLLADDEFLVRLAFSNTIAWKENGFELIGTASNGLEAYEMIRKEQPEIVITDLTMPQMDGLELIERVKAEGFSCEFVVLSCHNEFEYVKQALKLGVFDYILKLSMDMKELMDILKRLKERISVRKPAENGGMEIFSQQELENARFRVAVVKAGSAEEEEQEKVNNQIVSFLQQMTTAMDNKSVFIYHNVPVLLMWERFSDLEQLLGEVQEEIAGYLGFTVEIGVGSPVMGNINIRQSFEEAMLAYGHRFYKGEGSLSFYEKIHYKEERELSFSVVFPDISDFLRMGIRRELKEEVPRMLDLLREREDIEPHQLRMYLHELLTRIKLQTNEEKPGVIYGKMYSDVYKQINQLEYLEGIKLDFIYFLDVVLEQLNLADENEIVTNAKKYVHANLQADLKVMQVSRQLGVNADYLSHLFRTETGIRFIDYVNHVRISFACERLRASNDKIYEIAERSGFENTNYFIKVFKKNTGMTPLGYKKSQENIKI